MVVQRRMSEQRVASGSMPAPDAQQRVEALLAAEARARNLGAIVLRLNVFGHDHVAIQMIDGLGYQTTATQMILRLDERIPTAPYVDAPGVALRPMSQSQYDVFRAGQEDTYAADLARSGTVSLTEARERAVAELEELLACGLGAHGQLLLTAYKDEDEVGDLWLQVESESDGLHAFVYDIVVREKCRRRGHGRSIMRKEL